MNNSLGSPPKRQVFQLWRWNTTTAYLNIWTPPYTYKQHYTIYHTHSARCCSTTACPSRESALWWCKTPPGKLQESKINSICLKVENLPLPHTYNHHQSPHVYIHMYTSTTTTYNHHHTGQVAQVQVEYLCQRLEGNHHQHKVAVSHDYYMCKWSICVSWWKEI